MIFYLWKWIVARIDVHSPGGGLPRRYAPRNDEISTMNDIAGTAWRSSTLILLPKPQGNRLPRRH